MLVQNDIIGGSLRYIWDDPCMHHPSEGCGMILQKGNCKRKNSQNGLLNDHLKNAIVFSRRSLKSNFVPSDKPVSLRLGPLGAI